MLERRRVCRYLLLLVVTAAFAPDSLSQVPPGSSPAQSAHSSQSSQKATHSESSLDAGAISNGVYRNKNFGLACKIPEGWVLRTDEMNARDESNPTAEPSGTDPSKSAPTAAPSEAAKVLLAAFSRPPEAKGEDVNSSILIAAESVSAYPGLKEAGQYFEPLTEVAKAQGFLVDEEPYEYALGAKTLVRGDFHKDVGTRVMRQSTLVMLARGYAVSITVIGGTEDEVEELVDGLSFDAGAKKSK